MQAVVDKPKGETMTTILLYGISAWYDMHHFSGNGFFRDSSAS